MTKPRGVRNGSLTPSGSDDGEPRAAFGTPERPRGGRLRAALRAAAVVAVCSWLGARLTAARLRRGGGRGRAERAALAGSTARRCLALLGLDVEVAGAFPAPPYVVVANHRSYVDIALLLAHAPVVFLSKAAIARWPLAGLLVRLVGTVFVERRSAHSGVRAYRRLEAVLREGGAVAMFPEGTTARVGSELPFKPGAFRLAANAEVPVVPVAIEYAEAGAAWDEGGDLSLLPHFVRVFGQKRMGVRLFVGSPIESGDPEEARLEAARVIRSELERSQALLTRREEGTGSPPGSSRAR